MKIQNERNNIEKFTIKIIRETIPTLRGGYAISAQVQMQAETKGLFPFDTTSLTNDFRRYIEGQLDEDTR